MEIVLKQDIASLGKTGTVVDVAPGYARNYLFPRQMAMAATPANLKMIELEAHREERRIEKTRDHLKILAAKLTGVSVTAKVQVGEDDKVFGSVTNQVVAELLKEAGHEVDRHSIIIEEPLKALGRYDVEVKMGHGVSATIVVWIVRE